MQPASSIHWKTYPALLLSGCLATGIVLEAHAAPGFWFWAGVLGLGACVLGGVRPLARRRLVTPVPLVATLTVGMLAMALGGARYASQQALPPSHLIHHTLPDDSVLLQGRVTDVPVERRSGTRFSLEASTLTTGRDTLAISGAVQITLTQPRRGARLVYPPVLQGDVVQLRGRLQFIPPRRNPADFDYRRYLQQRGVYARLSVYATSDVVLLGEQRSWLESILVVTQQYIGDQLDRHVARPGARALLHALIRGDRSSLESETRQQFVRTGLMHLLAVSGLHVLLVGMVLYGLLRPFLLRIGLRWRSMEVVRAMLTMTVLLLYMFIAGASPSVVRAVIMTGLFIGATIFQRAAHPLNTLGVAALTLLLVNPVHLFEPGFQLSFAAVAAIVTLYPRGMDYVPESWTTRPLPRHLIASSVVSLAATLGTMPILFYHFGQASLAGLVLNVLAIPLTALLLASGLGVLLTGGWFAAAAAVFGAAADGLAWILLRLVALGDDRFAWMTVRHLAHHPWYLLALTALLGMCTQWPRPRHRWRLAATSFCFAAIGIWTGLLGGRSESYLKILFFDVGHGDAALVAFPNGKHLLIDAGGRDAYTDHGARTLLPHLERYGIDGLSAVVITHPHSDHLGGLPALLRKVPVGRVLHNGQAYASNLFEETEHLIDSLRLPHRALRAGDTLHIDPSVRIQVLAPEARPGADAEANNASVVLRLRYGDTAFLFTGDAEAETEQDLLARYAPLLESDVVKVGHHGSSTSSTPAFVRQILPDTTRPALAVVSVGRQARFGLPDEEVIARWHARGADVWTTAHHGALWLRSDGRQVEKIDWRRQR